MELIKHILHSDGNIWTSGSSLEQSSMVLLCSDFNCVAQHHRFCLFTLLPNQNTDSYAETRSYTWRIPCWLLSLLCLLIRDIWIHSWNRLDQTNANYRLTRTFRQNRINNCNRPTLGEQLAIHSIYRPCWQSQIILGLNYSSRSSPLCHHIVHCLHRTFRGIFHCWTQKITKSRQTCTYTS